MKNFIFGMAVLFFGVSAFSQTSPSPVEKVVSVAQAEKNEAEALVQAELEKKKLEEAEKREKLARQIKHDNDDLDAQRKAANAAQRSATYAAWQLLLSAFGVIGLILTLLYTRKSIFAAELSAQAAQASLASTHKQLRAYVSADVEIYTLAPDQGKRLEGIRLEVNLKNSGGTPAHQTTSFISYKSTPENGEFPGASAFDGLTPSSETILGGGTTDKAGEVVVTREDLISLVSQKRSGYLFFKVAYQDVFAEQHETTLCWQITFHFDIEKREAAGENWYDKTYRVYNAERVRGFGRAT